MRLNFFSIIHLLSLTSLHNHVSPLKQPLTILSSVSLSFHSWKDIRCMYVQNETHAHYFASPITGPCPNFKASLLCCRPVRNVRGVPELCTQQCRHSRIIRSFRPTLLRLAHSAGHCCTATPSVTTWQPRSGRLACASITLSDVKLHTEGGCVTSVRSIISPSFSQLLMRLPNAWANERSTDLRCRVVITSLSENWLMSTLFCWIDVTMIADLNTRNDAYIYKTILDVRFFIFITFLHRESKVSVQSYVIRYNRSREIFN